MYKGMQVVHIVATGLGGEIGANNTMLWHIKNEFAVFRELTLGGVLVMGRKTIESLPAPLKHREVISVSRKNENGDLTPLDFYLDNAVKLAKDMELDSILICGGGEIYKQTQKYVDVVYKSVVKQSFSHADTFYDYSFLEDCRDIEIFRSDKDFITFKYNLNR